jgi:ribonuclease Z
MRELVVLGTASQVPTRARNHNGYLLRWDDEGFLFDPGEGTQRQMSQAGVTATNVSRVCITHFHGDHCLGVPGVLQRLSLDQVDHPVHAHYPASGADYFNRLRHASAYYAGGTKIVEEPVVGDGDVAEGDFGTLTAHRLDHPVETYGYRLVEPDGRRMLPERLTAYGISGPDVGRLAREGQIDTGGRVVTLDEVSEVRRGQRFAFVMDTRLCDAVYALAQGVDLLVIEATYLDIDADLATVNAHLTAAQAVRVAAQSGVRRVLLTHFSQRYEDLSPYQTEAAAVAEGYDIDVVIAQDLDRVPVPSRR